MKSIKIFPPQLRAIETILVKTFFEDNLYGDKNLKNYFKQHKELGSKDRKIIAEVVYFGIRWWRKLWFALDKDPSKRSKILQQLVSGILTLNFDVINKEQLVDLPENFKEVFNNNKLPLAIEASIPDWIDELGKKEIGDKWADNIFALNESAPVTLRANRLKTDRLTLQTLLTEDNISTEIGVIAAESLILKERRSLMHHKLYKEGLFEFQDESSQLIAELCDPKPEQIVIDYCAGAGGKTLHLAAMMEDKGKIFAYDHLPKRLNELKRRNQRAKIKILNYPEKSELPYNADIVLLDAPCSGLGTLKRKPDLKWKLQPSDIDECIKVQEEILRKTKRYVKAGGHLIYATCSILPSEGEKQIENFLKQYTNFELIEERRVSPDVSDGFYMAKLRKVGT